MFSSKLQLIFIIGLLTAALAGFGGGLFLSSSAAPTGIPVGGSRATEAPTSVLSARPTAVTPAATAIPRPTSAPTPVDMQPRAPTFAFEPQQGRPGTVVAVRGWNFSPNTTVQIGIGFPSKAGPAFASATADSAGVWQTQVTIPDVQVSPGPDWSRARLIVLDDQARPLASAPFTYAPSTPDGSLTREAASQTVRDLLSAYTGGADVRPYLASSLHAQLDAGQQLDQLLNLTPAAIISFTVGAPLDQPSEVLFVPVTLRYSVVEEQRAFTLVVENGRWRVNGSGPAHPPNSGQPGQQLALDTVRDFLGAYTSGEDVQSYLAIRLRTQLDAGQALEQVLDVYPTELISFTLGTPEDPGSEVLFVPVTLVYSSGPQQRIFTLAVEDGRWRINGSGPAHPATSTSG